MAILTVRKLADKSSGRREVRFDPITGERKLVNPDTPGSDHEPWPLGGVEFLGDPPSEVSIPVKYVDQAVREGWMQRVGERLVTRPAGRTQDEWIGVQGVPHTFIQCDRIVLRMVEGDYTYRVTLNPDKYVADEDDYIYDPEAEVTPELYEAGMTRVVNHYRLELIDG